MELCSRAMFKFFFFLLLFKTTICIKSSHVVDQLNLITKIMKEDVITIEQNDVDTLLSKLREIEDHVKQRSDMSGQTDVIPNTKTQIQDRGEYRTLEIIQKAFNAEKQLNIRTRRDQLELQSKFNRLEAKADKCELTSAFSVIQTSLQMLNKSQQASQDSIVRHLNGLQNRTQHVEQLLSAAVSQNKNSSNIVQPCTQDVNSSQQTNKSDDKLHGSSDVKPQSCINITFSDSGVYTVYPKFKPSGLQVYCDMDTDGGGWIVFQRRKDGSTDFYRNWNEYKDGFGKLDWEFWIGNDNLHGFTTERQSELRIDLIDENGNKGYAKYTLFKVGSERDDFTLFIKGYEGNIGDSLSYHNNMKFSTKDKNNDKSGGNCASLLDGAWWYNSCHNSNLNGNYFFSNTSGLSWYYWHNDINIGMKFTEMKLRWKYLS